MAEKFELIITLICLLTLKTSLIEGVRCRFQWPGTWLENNSNEMNITHNSFGSLGNCVQRSADMVLLTSETKRGACYRCLVLVQLHENVLQYKTSQCVFEDDINLNRCIQLITADTKMHTIYRKDALPVACPVEAPLNFTYQTNNGICKSRISHLHRCAQHDRLTLHYQACPEVPNRESSIWHMECIATWQQYEGSYFAARIGYRAGEQHKCFIHKQIGSSGTIGMSAEAGCQELTSIGAASTMIHYRQDSPIYTSCRFPDELSKNEKLKSWESMIDGTIHHIHRGTWISSIKDRNETVWNCQQQLPTDSEELFSYRTHVTKGCKIGYQCVKLHLRKSQIIHVEYGEIHEANEFVDCSDFSVDHRDTLILTGAQESCPMSGKHFAPAPCDQKKAVLEVGCSSKYSMRLTRNCRYPAEQDEMICVSHFKNVDNEFLIARDALSRQLYCMTYISDRINLLRVYDRISCDALSVNGALPVFTMNFTSTDSCSPSLLTGFLYSSKSSVNCFSCFNFLIIFVIFCYF